MTEPDRGPLEPELAELRDRLAADLAALQDTISLLDQAQSEWRPAPDCWSVGEILHHLVISNRAFAVVVRGLVRRGRREGLTARPEGRRRWPRLRAVADSRASGPVKNPEFATPTHGLAIDELRRDLADSHAAVEDQAAALSGLDLDALRMPHPLGFDLNLFQWVDIAGAHERRHLAQILAIVRSPGFPVTGR